MQLYNQSDTNKYSNIKLYSMKAKDDKNKNKIYYY